MLRVPTWCNSLDNQCVLALCLGISGGTLLPQLAPFLVPLGNIFLRASQVVVMPFLICELVASLGSLSNKAISNLFRGGLFSVLLIWGMGAAMVLWLPQYLPNSPASNFFNPSQLRAQQPTDLIALYIPFNIFSALASDNFPGVVLYSAVLGTILQRQSNRTKILDLLNPLRDLFKASIKLASKIIPVGIFALCFNTVATSNSDQLLQSQGFVYLCAIALLIISLASLILATFLTPFSPQQLWKATKGPFALTASSGNLLIALPILISNLNQLLLSTKTSLEEKEEEIAAIISVGFTLPMLGQIASLLFIPFAGWYVNQPLNFSKTLTVLGIAIPSLAGGLKTAFQAGLLEAGLPLNLMGLMYINSEWLYRFEKVISLEGLLLMALLTCCFSMDKLRLKPLLLSIGLLASIAISSLLGNALKTGLGNIMLSKYNNNITLMNLKSLIPEPRESKLLKTLPAANSNLDEIRARGFLRVGLNRNSMPWVYRNRAGELVGFDVDLVNSLTKSLNLKVAWKEGNLNDLEKLINQQRLDIVIGGINANPDYASQFSMSKGYLKVHLGLVVSDKILPRLQQIKERPFDRPLVIAISDPELINEEVRDYIAKNLGASENPIQLKLVVVSNQAEFFSSSTNRYDALLTSAEGGSTWAVLHPSYSLWTPFYNKFSSELVVISAKENHTLTDYINAWLKKTTVQELISKLYNHWIIVK
jgi:Na+/H+-dicarboxylate symporter/ABC-type amino acid transport substrate-binding protein